MEPLKVGVRRSASDRRPRSFETVAHRRSLSNAALMNAKEGCVGNPNDSGTATMSPPPGETRLAEFPAYTVTYFGEYLLDRRYTQAMLSWVIAGVRRRNERRIVTLEVSSTTLRAAYHSPEGLQVLFDHELHNLFRFTQVQSDRTYFAYLSRVSIKEQFSCHVFQAPDESQVLDLFTDIREASQEAVKQAQLGRSKEGKSVDSVEELQENGCKLFEVLYIGKVLVSETRTPATFIDEAVAKFQQYEETRRMMDHRDLERQRHASGASIRSLPCSLERAVSVKENELGRQVPRMSGFNGSTDSNISIGTASSTESEQSAGSLDPISSNIRCDLNEPNITEGSMKTLVDSHVTGLNQNNSHKTSDPQIFNGDDGYMNTSKVSNSVRLQGRRNHTMLFQIGATDVCLISTDKKTVILQRKFRDISFCVKGIERSDHFGFVSREPANDTFICYVFRSSSDAVVEDLLATMKQAFESAFAENAKHHVVCELCPMHQLHKLCQEIEGLPASEAYELLQKRVDQLTEKDHNEIMNKFKSENPKGAELQVEVLMYLLLRMCEAKQREHTHISLTNRAKLKYEFHLLDSSKYLPSKFDHFKSKAKKSLANSFENLKRWKEGESEGRDQGWTSSDSVTLAQRLSDPTSGTSPCISPTGSPFIKEANKSFQFPSPNKPAPNKPRRHPPPRPSIQPTRVKPSPPRRMRSCTLGTLPSLEMSPEERDTVTSPQRNGTSHDTLQPQMPVMNRTQQSLAYLPPGKRSPQRSWRMGIFNRVVTPAKRSVENIPTDGDVYSMGIADEVIPRRKLTPPDLRALWRKAILETLLLIRMEKENISLQAHQDAVETKRMKLDYEEITPCLKEVTRVWDEMLVTQERAKVRFDFEKLNDAVKAGVPQRKRGDIWRLLVEQYPKHNPGCQKSAPHCSAYNMPYDDLLKQLTTHQHAILIDLGRTFPGHPYFSRALGAGQLSLFNLLKAYSLIDTEVGYCQGLSFVAGILLMHMQEEVAFETLKHLMFAIGFRRQYRPDMVALQIQMYQLSRLLHDMHRDLYDHFEAHEIVPTLYAAPWFLTMFASQFPLGFVARVFDLIFLQGLEVVFKVALVLLGNHKELIKQYDNLESIVEFLKTTLPEMGIIQMERVINQVFQLDISRQLHAYEVEYHVFQEEMLVPPSGGGDAAQLRTLEASHASLQRQNRELVEQLTLAHSRSHSMEAQAQAFNSELTKLTAHVRTLELERAALLNTVGTLRTLIPAEVLQASHIQLPPLNGEPLSTGSPIHNPMVERIQEAGELKLRSGASLTELDKEVTALMARKHRKDHLSPVTQEIDTGRPSPSSY